MERLCMAEKFTRWDAVDTLKTKKSQKIGVGGIPASEIGSFKFVRKVGAGETAIFIRERASATTYRRSVFRHPC